MVGAERHDAPGEQRGRDAEHGRHGVRATGHREERSLLDGHQIVGPLSELAVGAGRAQLVVGLDGRDDGLLVDGVDVPLLSFHVGVDVGRQLGEGLALDELVLRGDLHVAHAELHLFGMRRGPLLANLGPVRRHDGEELRRHGILEIVLLEVAAHEVVQVGEGKHLVHKALAVDVQVQEGQLQTGQRAAAMNHLRMVHRRHLRPGPDAGHHAHAVAEGAHGLEAAQVGAVVIAHLLVAGAVAGGKDDALGGLEERVALLGLADHAGHALAFLVQLHSRGVEEELHALGGYRIADGQGRVVVGAFQVVVGVRVQVVGVAVVLALGIVGLRFGAALGRRVGPPGNGLIGVAGPCFQKLAVRAVGVLLHEEGDAGLDAGLVGLGGIHRGAHVAGGLGGSDVLDAGYLGPCGHRGVGGGQARLACAHDNDVVLAGICEVGDGLGGLQECGQPGIGRAGIRERGRLRGGFRGAAREGARSHDSGGGQSGELEQIATSDFHGDPPKYMRLVRAALPLRSAGRTIFFGFARPSSAADGSHHGLGHKIAHRADR